MLHTTSDRRLSTITDSQRGWSGGVDSAVQQFITSTYANITDVTQISALNYLVTSLKENNLWSKFYVLYPFIGANPTSHRYNLVDPSQYAITFTGSFVHDASGISGTISADATATTNFNESVITDLNDYSFGYYGTYNSTGQITFGTGTTIAASSFIYSGTSWRIGGGTVLSFTTAANGLQMVTSTSTVNSSQFFRNQFTQGTTTISTTKSGSYIIQLSRTVTASANSMKLAFIAREFSDSELQLFNAIVETYQALLSRGDYAIDTQFNRYTNRFLNSVGPSNVSTSEKYALDYLISNVSASTIYGKLRGFYPIVGTTAAVQTRDLINLTSATLSGSFTHDALGLDPVSTSSYMAPVGIGTLGGTPGFAASYINEQNAAAGQDINGTTARLVFQVTNAVNTTISVYAGTTATTANTTTTGLWLIDIPGYSLPGAVYRNGASFLSYTSGAVGSTVGPYFMGGPSVTGGTRRIAFAAWGVTRLTSQEITDLNTWVQQYQIMLGRA